MSKTITSNDEYIRMRIYEGEFTPNEAYQELLRIEKEQRKSDAFFNQERINNLLKIIDDKKEASSVQG